MLNFMLLFRPGIWIVADLGGTLYVERRLYVFRILETWIHTRLDTTYARDSTKVPNSK